LVSEQVPSEISLTTER
jgi:hypothetical protein